MVLNWGPLDSESNALTFKSYWALYENYGPNLAMRLPVTLR